MGPKYVWCGKFEQVSAEDFAGDAVTTEVDGYDPYVRIDPGLLERLRTRVHRRSVHGQVYGADDDDRLFEDLLRYFSYRD